MSALAELQDCLHGPRIGRDWVAHDLKLVADIRMAASNLQLLIGQAADMANLSCTKDALRELSDHIDDGRASLDALPDAVEEAEAEFAQTNGQFGVGA